MRCPWAFLRVCAVGVLALAFGCDDGGSSAAQGPGFRPDSTVSGRLDAAPEAPEPDAALPPSPAECASVCGWLAACAAAPDDTQCLAIGPGDEEDLEVACRRLCVFVADFDALFPSEPDRTPDRCSEGLVGLKSLSRDLAELCVPFPPPPVEACIGFGERVSSCVEAECAAVADVRAGLSWWMRLTCEQSVAVGDLPEAQVPAYAGPDVPCDAEGLSALVESLLASGGVGGRSGPLAGLCANGPARPITVCERACERLAPCVGGNSSLANRDYCTLVCAVERGLADAFQCASTSPDCGPLSACFGP